MKRMAFVSCSIKDGRLFLYQKKLLQEIKKVAQNVVLISNQRLNALEEELCIKEGIQIQYSDYVYDISMWREILFLEKREVDVFDSLIVLNDSFFGPLYPLDEIFDEMDKKKIDFWGITAHGKIARVDENGNHIGEWPRFVQRYFMVFNSSLFKDKSFWSFWESIPNITAYIQTETEFEYILTDMFEKKGFKWDVYCNTEIWENNDSNRFLSFLLFEPYNLLYEKKLPVIAKEIFFIPKEIELCYHCGSEIKRVLEFIREKSYYSLNYIYDYLISEMNVYDIWEKLNCTYVLQSKGTVIGKYKTSKKVVVIAHLYYEDMFHKSISYLKNIPHDIDIIITTNSDEKNEVLQDLCKEYIRNRYSILTVTSRGREWSALLVNVKDKLECYDYICFVHDKKSAQMFYPSVGKSFNDYLWENMLASDIYISNVLEQFEKNERLGLLVPPVVYHGEFWGHAVDFWTICYENTKELAEKLDLKHNPDANKPLLTIGSTFWARVSALDKLLKYPFCMEDFPEEPMAIDGTINHALERILSFVAQDAGYYTGWILSECYAECDLNNMRVLLQKIMAELEYNKDVDITSTFSTVEGLKKMNISKYSNKNSTLREKVLSKCKINRKNK